jgi:hypothetical protein
MPSGSLGAATSLVAVLAACGGASQPAAPPVEVPARTATAGDELLAVVPAGAELILELDIARLRANAAVGPVVTAMAGQSSFGLGFDLVRDADTVVMASYSLGSAEAATLTVVRGDRVGQLREARRLDDRTAALGPASLLDRAEAAATGSEPSMAADAGFLRLRTAAMPEAAPGASLRATARLDFDARVGLASMFDLDAAPVTVSIWGDVADDLAVVALLRGDDPGDARELTAEVEAWRARWSRAPALSIVFRTLVSAIEVAPKGDVARAVLVIGPRRLEQLVALGAP